jgi:hypothetical protein
MVDRVYAQYADKPKAVAWYGIVPSLAAQIDAAAEQVRNAYDIDAMSGQALDVIGRIVVIDRSFSSFVAFDPDAVFGSPELESQFGGDGAQFNSTGGVLSQDVNDQIFRILIRSKISKNNNDASLDGIVTAISFITSATNVMVTDHENMTFSISLGSLLTDAERFVLRTFPVAPRPQGVKFLGYTEEPLLTQFGGPFAWGDVGATFGQYFGV